MRFTIRFFALLTLLGWFFATGHIALHHGGVANPGAHHALLGGGDDTDHDDDVPAQDGEHHHHDLAALADGRWMKSAEHKVLAPVWVPTFDALADRLVDRRCVRREPRLLPTSEHAPPDERAGGWLLDYQTALPVRGPSLTV